MTNIKNLFLQNSYNDLKSYYNKVLNGTESSWDVVVLTASNETQAKSYELQIQMRQKKNTLPKQIDFIVIPDRNGQRIGSGGATLNVIYELNKKYDLSTKKVLIMHSGGDSKRIPQYSNCGKLFAKVPKKFNDSIVSSLFDETILMMSDFPKRMEPGILIMCGDSLVLFNPLQVDLQYKKAAVISTKMNKEIGINHGVFVSDEDNTVIEFLHKQPLEVLEQKAVTDGCINFDTGIIYFHYDLIKEFLSLIKDSEKYDLFVSPESCLNIYGDFLYPLAKNSTFDQYLKENSEKEKNSSLLECRKILWNILRNYQLKIVKLSPSLYLHFGTTKEFLELMTNELNTYSYLDFQKDIMSYSSKNSKATIINSILLDSKVDDNVYIENSYLEKVKIGKNVIVSNTRITNQIIPDNIVLSTLLLKSGKYVTRIYDVSLNPKEIITSSTKMFGKNNVVLNEHIGKSLWNADLYAVSDNETESVEYAFILYKIMNNTATKIEFDKYIKSQKMSLNSSFNEADTDKMLLYFENIEKEVIKYKVLEIINKHQDLYIAKELIEKSGNKEYFVKYLNTIPIQEEKMRIYYLLALIDHKSFDEYTKKSLNSIQSRLPQISKNDKSEFKLDVVEVVNPVRINLGGGWSDTPRIV